MVTNGYKWFRFQLCNVHHSQSGENNIGDRGKKTYRRLRGDIGDAGENLSI